MAPKPVKPPRVARLLCPGHDFQSRDRHARLQPAVTEPEDPLAREMRAFDEACARAYWLALLRD
jgi:hypothetical protein